jgi:hypothetical protein
MSLDYGYNLDYPEFSEHEHSCPACYTPFIHTAPTAYYDRYPEECAQDNSHLLCEECERNEANP